MMQIDRQELRGSVHALCKRLEQATASDAEAERQARKCGKMAGFGFGGAFLSVFLAAFGSSFGLVVLWVLPPLGIAVGVFGLVKYLRWSKFDLDNRKLGTALRVLQMIEVDTPKDVPMTVVLDLRDYRKGGELRDKQEERISFQLVRTFKYEHQWLEIDGTLADGSSYRLTVTERITRKEKPKRKYTKVREATRAMVGLELSIKPHWGTPENAAAMLQQQQPPAALRLEKIAVRGRKLSLALSTGTTTSLKARYGTTTEGEENLVVGDTLLQAMVWVYDALGRARTAA